MHAPQQFKSQEKAPSDNSPTKGKQQFKDQRPASKRVAQLKEVTQFKSKKKTGIAKTVRQSGAANVISSLFIEQHMGNYLTAEKMANKRAGTIPGACHVVSISELSKLHAEINNRETDGYHAIVGNKVVNTATGNSQFKTVGSYKIFEFGYDKKNRVKKGKELNKKFFYDCKPKKAGGYILHHFDGLA